jgi:hypothetical protein
MFRLWARTQAGEKLTRQTIFSGEAYDPSSLFEYLTEICHALDISTPAVLPLHIRRMTEFNQVRFRSSDFVEVVDFDHLTVDYLQDRKKERQGL